MTELKWYQVYVNNVKSDGPWTGTWLMSDSRKQAVEAMPNHDFSFEEIPAPEGADLVEQVMAYARAHYDTGGWDVVVETMSGREIEENLDSLTSPGYKVATIEQVLEGECVLSTLVSVWTDRQADARNSVF